MGGELAMWETEDRSAGNTRTNVKFTKEKVIKLYSTAQKKNKIIIIIIIIRPVHSLKLHLSVMMIVWDYSRAMLSAPGELTSIVENGRKMQLKWGPEGSKLRLDIPLFCTMDNYWRSLNTFLTRKPVISDIYRQQQIVRASPAFFFFILPFGFSIPEEWWKTGKAWKHLSQCIRWTYTYRRGRDYIQTF